jgi:hypothetical protein
MGLGEQKAPSEGRKNPSQHFGKENLGREWRYRPLALRPKRFQFLSFFPFFFCDRIITQADLKLTL